MNDKNMTLPNADKLWNEHTITCNQVYGIAEAIGHCGSLGGETNAIKHIFSLSLKLLNRLLFHRKFNYILIKKKIHSNIWLRSLLAHTEHSHAPLPPRWWCGAQTSSI